jgi:FAD/FMN-containing dehydrogenase
MTDIVDLLRSRLGSGAVLAGSEAEARYRVDFSHENARAPLAVLRPTSTEEVAAILRECHRARQRVVVQGGLTGLAGGATPQANEIAISLERLTGIEQIDRAAQTMTVRA